MMTRFVKFEDRIFKLEPTSDGGAASFILEDGAWRPISIGAFTEAEFYGTLVKDPTLETDSTNS